MIRLVRLATPLFLLVASCMTYESVARRRASNEFQCPEEKVQVQQRLELSGSTFDVEACGHRARYTCIFAHGLEVCSREPMP